jgi:hypothetical protein
MRIVGMCLLGFGILLIVPSGLALTAAESLGEAAGWLACAALVPGSMIVGGIVLIRRAEDREPVTVRGEMARSPGPRGVVNDTMGRVMAFDLNRLNAGGWLLLLATFGFVIAEASILVPLVGDRMGDRGLPKAIALPALLLAVGFFFGMRWVLGLFGVSIYRS